ncbi:hypothetical protein OROMI_002281 [Orobanche minor]
MDKDSLNDSSKVPSLSNILHDSIIIHSERTIGQDGNVQFCCGLKLTEITSLAARASTSTHCSTRSDVISDRVQRLPKKTTNEQRSHLKGVPVCYNNLGPSSYECPNCAAMMWYEERTNKARRSKNPTFSLCCQDGKVLLPKLSGTPPPLNKLLDYSNAATSKFRDQIRVYNSMFCFTSFGAKIDHSVNTGRGPYTFKLNGQNYHLLGSLLPTESVQPRFAQLYFFDTDNEVRNRMSAFIHDETGEQVDERIVTSLIVMLNQSSSVAKAFRMARDWCNAHNSVNFQLRLLGQRTTSRQYNMPSVSEVAALITNDFGEGVASRDIIVNNKDTGPQRISELHPVYMALQYPLLFPYGEDGFHEKILYHNNTGSRKTTCGFVTMKEYYSYMIQQRNNQGNTLIRGGRLFQQYLVDAYTAIEEQRLKWTRNNQETLRVDLYHNVYDAVTRGDTDVAAIGKRILLPSSFTGSPRYMMQNYQDAMALCRAYGNPYLFITFTSNPKWPEIAAMLAYVPVQKPHDRPEVGTRVFKMKLNELLDDLTKKHIFGECCVVVYVIEFQKCGLPHAHILLWLEEHAKCKTPSEIDDIISAEIPSPTHDPDGYRVVTEYMLHGPCGTKAKHAPCNVEGKCSKHFPKSFYAETTLDEDGYPTYRRRDTKVCAVKGKFSFTNKDVVPYNRYLLLKYQAHINVEWCNRTRAINVISAISIFR